MIRALAVLALLAAAPAAAQEAAEASGAVLRGLDKISGTTTDIVLRRGQTGAFGKLELTLSDCRYPAGDRSADAWAHLTINDAAQGAVAFDGWMIASSPALNALDHPRYDVWVLGCTTD